jgi:anaerobic magnesium-protoporphyrin IX monomethyl ester cyclase
MPDSASSRQGGQDRGTVVLFNAVDGTETSTSRQLWMPMSILTVGSYLAAHGFKPILVDCQIHDDWEQRLSEGIEQACYLGVTCMTGPSIRHALRAIDIARQAAPEVPIVWGGYHATLAHKAILTQRLASVTVVGQGENQALMLAELFARDSRPRPAELDEIPNIAYGISKVNGDALGSVDVVRTPRARMMDMNLLPPVDYELLPPTEYFNEHLRKLPYISSYGCPYGCTYCAEPTTSGRQWRPLEPVRVANETSTLYEQYEPDVVDFVDPNFSSNPKRVVAFVEALEERGPTAKYTCCMRARDVVMLSERMDLHRLANAGFVRIFLGIESGSDRLLKALNKASTVQDAVVACEQLSRVGIETFTSFMHDLPSETPEDSDATIALARHLARLDGNLQAHHYYMPFPGTALFETHAADGLTAEKPQIEWAESSTKWSRLWSGTPELRARVTEQLEELRTLHPSVFALTLLPADVAQNKPVLPTPG